MVPAETLVGLQNLLVHLRDVSAENAHVYQYRLWDAKRVKVETAQNRGVSPDGAAGYRDGLRLDHQRPPALRRGGTEGRQPGEPALQLAAQRVVAVNACRTAPEGSAGRLLSLLDQLRLPDAGALPDWGLHPAETLVGLQNLLVHLRDVSAENAHVYQYRLWDVKRVKVETAQNRGVPPDGAAGYRDGLRRATNGHPLSAEEVQKVVSRQVQMRCADGSILLSDSKENTIGVYQGGALSCVLYMLFSNDLCLSVPEDVTIVQVVAVNACRTAPEGSAGRLLSLLDQLRLPDAGALPDWGLHPAETLVGLQNLLVHLRNVSAENAHVYQYRLWDAKRVKVETAQNRGVPPDGAAGYLDGLRRATNGHPLSAEEVQKVVSRVNQLSS
ncbi:hypothetical protein FJT64_018450 [Amphibalanus amphitrite]|uniref:Uncharacterized protein n=1 Tax=Amphibalanus amphitrite TaxID=1232801 RepID=A0A6A4X6J3_AMPAM|nr:hypothetical protein FJT64_018450 [Amphibalanus amphitrite]